MNPSRDGWLFWAMFSDPSNHKNWELGVIKISINREDVDKAFEENLDPVEIIEKFGQGIATIQVSCATIQKAAEVGYKKIKERGWMSIEEYLINSSKYRTVMQNGIQLYGCVEMEKLPESLRLQALAGEVWQQQ